MNNTTIGILAFAAGAGVGAAVTWIFAKKKCDQRIAEEVESVKETYAKRNEPEDTEDTKEKTEEAVDPEDEDYVEYVAQTQAYVSPEYTPPSDKPYVVSPYEFGEIEDYDKFTLTYYADNIVTDENDCILEDIEGNIGFESLSHFGEYAEDPDSVYVRNDRLKCDFEILRDQRPYTDVLNAKPYLLNTLEAEDE